MGASEDFLSCTKAGHERVVIILQLCKISPWRRKGQCVMSHELSTEALPI